MVCDPDRPAMFKTTEDLRNNVTADNMDALRGYEGQGSALYFAVFNLGFDQDQGFVKRVRRPPTDPVNAVLSLLYTFLYNQVYSAIRQVHLDPYLGHLHTPDYGRCSLVLDLMEEFRPVIVDTLVFALFNMGILKKAEDFITGDDSETEENEEDAARALAQQAGESGNELFDTAVQRMEERFSMPVLLPLSAWNPASGPRNSREKWKTTPPGTRCRSTAQGKVVAGVPECVFRV